MSDYERTRGILKKVETDDIEKYCEGIIRNKMNIIKEMPSYYDSYAEWLSDIKTTVPHVMIDGTLYEIEDFQDEYDPNPDYCHITKLEDGRIMFDAMYYNGGTCWEEMVEEELKKNKENK